MPPKNPKFDLKLKYQRVFEISLILSILVLISAFSYFPKIEKSNSLSGIIVPPELITIVDPPPVGPEIPPPPVIKVIVDETLTDDELEDIEIEDTVLDENDIVSDLPPHFEEDVTYEEDIIFEAVEKMPGIIGGLSAIQNKVIYPEIAKRAGVQGKVLVQAIIGKDGKVESAKIFKGVGAGCDEAALYAVLNTQFTPGKQRDKPVRVQISIPISFKLN